MDYGHSEEDLDIGIGVLEELDDFNSIETEELIFPDSGGKLDLDIVGYSGDQAVLLELKNSLNKLYGGFKVLETGINHLQSQGYNVQTGMLILDEELIELRETLENLPSVYDKHRLGSQWKDENTSIESFVSAGICHDINNLPEETREQSIIPKYDWNVLDQMGWVEETREGYTGTEILEKAVESHGEILHTTQRQDYLIHPKDYIEKTKKVI